VLLAAAASAADLKKGQEVYAEECQACHGESGAPNAALAKKLKVTMKDLRDPAVMGKSDEEHKRIILKGVGKMKPVKIPAPQADDVLAYVKTFKK
ncbi:MAG: c-type cytochrome, partial [Bryobacteraceae bacterium]